MKSPIYLRRALIAGTAAALAVAGVAVGAAPTFAANTGTPQSPVVEAGLNGCPTTYASPSLTTQPIQTDHSLLPITVADSQWPKAPTGYDSDTNLANDGNITCGLTPSYVLASDKSLAAATTAAAQTRWEGVSTALPGDTKTVSVNIYIDPSEQPQQVAGLLVNNGDTATAPAVAYSALGIIYSGKSFDTAIDPASNVPGTTAQTQANLSAGWNVYNPTTGAWTSITGAASTPGWYTLEISATATPGTYEYYINGQGRSVTLTGAGSNAVDLLDGIFANAFLVQYNNASDSYDTYYSGLSSSKNNSPAAITVNRLGGSDRYATAVAVSQSEFPNGFGATSNSTVVLATGENYADALSGAPLAALKNGALLLTQTNTLPSVTKTELVRLDPKNVIVLGGYGAVAQSVYTQIQAALPGVKLVQVAGSDRYATSLAIAQNYFSSTPATPAGGATADNSNGVGNAFIATGTAFPDALSAAPAAGSYDFPVLLVNGTSTTIPSALALWLKTNVTQTLFVAGGSGAVSPAVVNQLQSNIKGVVVPFSGTDRYDTNFLINGNNSSLANGNNGSAAGDFFPVITDPTTTTTVPVTTVYLATGANYPDALTGGAAAGNQDAPLYLTNGTCVPANVLSAIQSFGTVTTINVLGGTGAQSANIAALKSC